MQDTPPPGGPLRVLIVCPNASARFGGEAFLPLRYFRLLAERGHPVRLLTHARVRDELTEALPHLADRIDYVEDTALQRLVWRAGDLLPGRMREQIAGTLLDWLTEAAQAGPIRARIAAGEVELIHQPIPVSPKAPSLIHGFGVPVVIGPMNGGMSYPSGYEDHESRLARAFTGIGRRIAVGLNRLMPGKRRAATLLVANARTRAALPVAHPRVIDLPENAVDLSLWTDPGRIPRTDPAQPFRIALMGRLIRLKALDTAIEAAALARAQGTDARIEIIGDGPEGPALRDLAGASGVPLVFHGFLPQVRSAPVLAATDCLMLPSLRECGGAVVLEAMALGLPVIASDWGGPADYLDAGTGILVPPAPRADFAARLSAAILRLARDPAAADAMGRAAAARVRADFDWLGKIDRIEAIYRQALANPRA